MSERPLLIDETQIHDLVLKHLREEFVLFDETHRVLVHTTERGICVGYRTGSNHEHNKTMHFDIQIIDDICYTLGIGILRDDRGKGHGRALYRIIEGIARDCGCKSVRLTPSGWTHDGFTRAEYMERLGYHNIDGREPGEVEKVL